MPTPRLKTVTFSYPHYRCWVVLIYHPTMGIGEMVSLQAKKVPELKDITDDYENTVALTTTAINRRIYVFIHSRAGIGDLHHEMHHIMMELFAQTDMKVTRDTEENYAYGSAAIFEDILHALEVKYKINLEQFLKVK